jgi:TetR/AcrR family transcriptional regulator
MTVEPGTRRPGRPAQTDEEAARARANILRATAQVFGENGYHGTNVARIVEAAQIARPTFYRYFRNSDEAVTRVMIDCGQSVMGRVGSAITREASPEDKLLGAIDAYLDWADDYRHLLQSLYGGMHDPATIVAAFRPRMMDMIMETISGEFERAGRPRPDTDSLDLLLTSFQYSAYRLHEQGATPERTAATRDRMVRMVLGLLGDASDWWVLLERGVIG